MNTNLLIAIDEVNTSETLASFSDKLSYGGMMLLIGMLTVFSVLIVIMISLFVFKYFFHDMAKKSSTQKVTVTSPVQEPVYVAPVQDGEIVAAIAAAIAMAESESGGIKFRVVSFKRR